MIFAHGPLGFLIRYVRGGSGNTLTPRRQWMVLGIAFIGGIFPDIDLFYYALIDASETHRAFITHTPAFYIVLWVLSYALFTWMKRPVKRTAATAFFFGALSHMVADGIAAQILYLYPFSQEFYGLTDIGHAVINSNILFINFLLEGVIITLFFYALIVQLTKTRAQRLGATVVLLCVFAGGVWVLQTGNEHIYHGEAILSYGDEDADGIANYDDRDIDGDGVSNIDDLDADNDGEANTQEIIENVEDFSTSLYDPTNGGFLQIPLRMGLLTTNDSVRRIYQTVGIFIGTEMHADYDMNPEGYVTNPEESHFDSTPENIRVWLDHRGKLEVGDAIERGCDQIGDVVFFESGHVAVISGYETGGSAPYVFDVDSEEGVAERALSSVVEREGKITARGKMLDQSPAFENSTE